LRYVISRKGSKHLKAQKHATLSSHPDAQPAISVEMLLPEWIEFLSGLMGQNTPQYQFMVEAIGYLSPEPMLTGVYTQIKPKKG